MIRRTLALPLTVALSIVLVACGTDSGEPASAAATDASAAGGTISLLLGIAGNPYYEALTCGARAEAEALGYELTVAAPTEWSAAEQVPLINGVTASRPVAAIIAPTDPQALVGPIGELAATGAKVVTIDTTISDASSLVTQVVIDNEAGGRLAAQTLSELLDGVGKVMVIQGPQANNVETARRVGFEDEIAGYPDIEYIGVQYSESDPQRAAQFVTSTLASDPDLAGIFATNDLGAIGVLTGLEQADAFESVQVVAFDAATPQVNALRNGQISALVAQQPREMGVQAVRAVHAAIQGEPVDGELVVESVVIMSGDDEGADAYEYKADC